MSEKRFSFDIPPVWLGWFSLIAYFLDRLVPVWEFDVAPLGTIVIAVSVALIAWAAWWFLRKKTPIEPHHQPKALIVEGPYRISRNPIYTGLVAILFGIALNRGSATTMIPVILFPLLLTHRFVLPEEEKLRAIFGDEAEAYFAKTRRWIF